MRLDTIVLVLLIAGAAILLVVMLFGVGVAAPLGLLALVPVAIGIVLLAVVIYQRLTNKEDQHYDRNVDK